MNKVSWHVVNKSIDFSIAILIISFRPIYDSFAQLFFFLFKAHINGSSGVRVSNWLFPEPHTSIWWTQWNVTSTLHSWYRNEDLLAFFLCWCQEMAGMITFRSGSQPMKYTSINRKCFMLFRPLQFTISTPKPSFLCSWDVIVAAVRSSSTKLGLFKMVNIQVCLWRYTCLTPSKNITHIFRFYSVENFCFRCLFRFGTCELVLP